MTSSGVTRMERRVSGGKKLGLEANRFAHKIVDSAKSLDARESAARHDEGQKRLALARSAFGVSLLQMRDELIANCHCVANGFPP